MSKVSSLWERIPIYHYNPFRTENSIIASEDNQMDVKLKDDVVNDTIDPTNDYKYSEHIQYAPKLSEQRNLFYARNKETSINALGIAKFSCEIEKTHRTFIRRRDHLPYTEPHHLIPMSFQGNFDYSIDIEENIISLCSNCHNEIHYGENAKSLITKLYYNRKPLLERKKIVIGLDELLSYYGL